MTPDIGQFAVAVSWAATGIGVALWVWSWAVVREPIAKLRFMDCGMVLMFASILLRIAAQDKAMSPFDWVMAFLAPLFIAAGLYRLARTSAPPKY